MTAVAFCRLVQNQRLALSGTPRTVFETLWGQWYHRKTVLENAKGEKNASYTSYLCHLVFGHIDHFAANARPLPLLGPVWIHKLIGRKLILVMVNSNYTS